MMRNVSEWIQEHESMCIKIIRWIVFGVIASILPFLLMLSRYALSDLVGTELDYLLDLLLISIAVSANAVNLLWDSEKKISTAAKIFSISTLIIAMFYFAVTYTTLFEQTIWNNKMLEEYNELADSLEKVPVGSTNNSDYENIMQRLSNIKLIIDEMGPKPYQLKHRRYFSIVSLIAITMLGVAVEYFDDKKRRLEKAKSGSTNVFNPPPSGSPDESSSPEKDASESLIKKDGE